MYCHQIIFFKSVPGYHLHHFLLIFIPVCEKQLKSMGEKISKVYIFFHTFRATSLFLPGEIRRKGNIFLTGIYDGKPKSFIHSEILRTLHKHFSTLSSGYFSCLDSRLQ